MQSPTAPAPSLRRSYEIQQGEDHVTEVERITRGIKGSGLMAVPHRRFVGMFNLRCAALCCARGRILVRGHDSKTPVAAGRSPA